MRHAAGRPAALRQKAVKLFVERHEIVRWMWRAGRGAAGSRLAVEFGQHDGRGLQGCLPDDGAFHRLADEARILDGSPGDLDHLRTPLRQDPDKASLAQFDQGLSHR